MHVGLNHVSCGAYTDEIKQAREKCNLPDALPLNKETIHTRAKTPD